MHKSHAKRRRDIKNKLMAAICMLLVSSIMMVSTTYAWFTLSTAPEVTGINTAVGANGNLEIALMPKDGQVSSITSAAGDSMLAIEAKNVTWGNLVDLSDSSVYGLDSITLYPAALNGEYDEATGYLTTIGATMLKTPTYGSDGRVADLVANTSNGYYDSTEKDFYPNDYLGVRAIGTASGMTARQLAYRNARSAANTAASNAKTVASQSLNTNGSTLANIAIKYGTSGDAAKFNMADLEAMQAIIDGLLGAEGKTGALQYIENAYKQYILAYAASAKGPTVMVDKDGQQVEADTQPWQAIDTSKTLSEVISAIQGEGVTLPAELTEAIGKLNTSKSNVNTAQTTLSNLITAAKAEYAWSDISPVLTALANPENMEVNGIKASEIKQDDNMSKLVNSVASGGVRVTMTSGAGVYADISDHCGNFEASVVIEKVEYGGLTLNNMTARMATDSSVSPAYLSAAGTAVENAGAPASGNNTNQPITDMFGYVIDLAFRTNAAESNLLLQKDAVDRIYGDNENEGTMGHGSNMTFSIISGELSDKQVVELLKAIRLVFFTPANGADTANDVILCARLDVDAIYKDKTVTNDDGTTATVKALERDSNGNVVANLILYKEMKTADTTTYESFVYNGSNAPSGVTIYADNTGSATVETSALVEDQTYYIQKVTTGGVTEEVLTGENANVIMSLTQNTAHQLSVLVYLDGNHIGNDDVAAQAATSMVGQLNLQFASSATLVPMDYSQLHTPKTDAGNSDSGNTPAEPTP